MQNNYVQLIEDTMLSFIKKIDASDKFLNEFIEFEKGLFATKTITRDTYPNKKILELHDFLMDVLISPLLPKEDRSKGCALVGKTSFDKLEFVKKYLDDEYVKYAIIDCKSEIGNYKELQDSILSYKDYSYIIFDNSMDLLRAESILRDFIKMLNYQFGDNKLWYIFLGEENYLHEVVDINPNAITLVDEFLGKVSIYELSH